MPTRIGILSTAHLHVHSYIKAFSGNRDSSIVGVWDDDVERGSAFCQHHALRLFSARDELIEQCDAVVITSENSKHLENAQAAANAGRHILCEKPLVINEDQGSAMLDLATKVKLMTAFPCRFSPAYARLKERVAAGDIGRLLAVCATNHGMCPFGWFVEPELSGGGALIDHTVHVADLLQDLLGQDPTSVYAQTNSKTYGQSWDDTALLQLTYANSVFATIDASWSRPKKYKTWGDVKLNVVGEKGTIELDMFAQGFDTYSANGHGLSGYGSDLDKEMAAAFIKCIQEDTEPPITAADGLVAARVAFAGYRSAELGEPVPLAS